ncbi:hypothetical protein [Bacillus andreraoultii]|uniref:hypothetical protein n=1 Tax=Bacillus andreraoultii TaxID=1499685 RepID=UPI00053B1B83|nr:hypothetical protein [Bacillus andreraoultii]
MSNENNKNKMPTYFVQQPDYTVVIQGNNQKEYRFVINVEPDISESKLILDKGCDVEGNKGQNNMQEEKLDEPITELKGNSKDKKSEIEFESNEEELSIDEIAQEKELMITQNHATLQTISVEVDVRDDNEEIVNDVNDTENNVPIENIIQTKAKETEYLQLTEEMNEESLETYDTTNENNDIYSEDNQLVKEEMGEESLETYDTTNENNDIYSEDDQIVKEEMDEESIVTYDTTNENNDIYSEDDQIVKEEKEHRRKIRQLVKRLAFYPSVLDRPICEAKINGEVVNVQIISKRGNKVRIKKGRKLESIHINEIDELTILSNKL